MFVREKLNLQFSRVVTYIINLDLLVQGAPVFASAVGWRVCCGHLITNHGPVLYAPSPTSMYDFNDDVTIESNSLVVESITSQQLNDL